MVSSYNRIHCQAKKKEEAYESYFPVYLSKLEKMLSDQSGPFILGDRVGRVNHGVMHVVNNK